MVKLYEHNQKTYENICRMYNEGIQRVAVVQPTGSGKSLIITKLIEDNPNSRFFVLSTSHKINDQFRSKLDEESLKRINFNIYCNMPNMNEETMKALQLDYILLDEMHRALAKEWSKGIMRLLEMYPNAKVLGLSATPIRYLDRCRNVVEELFNGNMACDMNLSQAILDGILPMARYVCGVYSYEKDTESLNKKIEKSCNSDDEKKELLEQVKVLKQNLDKANGVSDIFRKYIVSGSEKFVVFLKDITHLRVMKSVIEKWFLDAGFTVRLYEVHCKNTDKDKEFLAFREDTEDGIVKVCLSVAMLTEGIHGDIDGVIMLRETISPNYYFQMIGRAFSCGKKTIPLIFDLVANSQFISDAVDNFPNELRGEIEKRKEECEKEGIDYEVDFDVDEFIVMDEFMDVVSGFRAIEGRLKGDWDVMFQEYCKFYEENGHGDVPKTEEYRKLNNWCQHQRQDLNNSVLKENRRILLNEYSFVWDVYRYRFQNAVHKCIRFYEKNGRLPIVSKNDVYERKLAYFIRDRKKEMENDNEYPTWKKDLLMKIPNFMSYKSEKRFDIFYKNALAYKEKYGHVDIKLKDIMDDGYKIGSILNCLKNEYKHENLTDDQINKIESLGISFKDRKDILWDKAIELIKEALNEGCVISASKPKYKGKDLYNWYLHHRDKCSDEELRLVNQLIPRKSQNIPIIMIDVQKNEVRRYSSQADAARILYKDFKIVPTIKAGTSCIRRYLMNKKIYKGRFKFEYVDNKVD